MSLHKFLFIIPIVFFTVLINVFIASTVSGFVMLNMMGGGYPKYVSLGVAILIAILTNTYIIYYHRIRNYINNQDVKEEDE